MPFHCIECDKPVNIPMNGLCDDCKAKDEEE
jgi:NMD protein affecting ribosome stability and mRNA decay